MAQSGAECDKATILAEMDKVKMSAEHTYFVAYIRDRKLITIDPEFPPGPKTEDFDTEQNKQIFNSLTAGLVPEKPKFIVFDFRFVNASGRKINKLALINWCSDDCNVKERMVNASSKKVLKDILEGIQHDFHATDAGDLNYDDLKKEIEQKAN